MFYVRYGLYHECSTPRAWSVDAALKNAMDQWLASADRIKQNAVIIRRLPGGGETIVVDSGQLELLIEAHRKTKSLILEPIGHKNRAIGAG